MEPTLGRRLGPILLLGATAAWLLALGWGFRLLLVYEGKPGRPGHPSAVWPSSTSLVRNQRGSTLVMAVHPMCGCSRASIDELARAVSHAPKLRVYVLAVIPDGIAGDKWENSSLLMRARQIPGVQVQIDRAGVEAKRFGAATSGFLSLYGMNGQLLFRGGITEARGHEGDNAGEDAVVAASDGYTPIIRQSPVFGCSLFATMPEQIAQAPDRGAK